MPDNNLRLTVKPHSFEYLIKNLLPNITGQHKCFVCRLDDIIDFDEEWVFPIYIEKGKFFVEFHVEEEHQMKFLQTLFNHLVEIEMYELAEDVDTMIVLHN